MSAIWDRAARSVPPVEAEAEAEAVVAVDVAEAVDAAGDRRGNLETHTR